MDGVVCVWVLQHVLDAVEFEATLDYLAEALKPGGSLFRLDRLCRDPVEEVGDYLCIRQRTKYLDAIVRRGLHLESARPVALGELVLGSPRLSRLVVPHPALHRLGAALNLRWARRQEDPFLADYLCHFRRLGRVDEAAGPQLD